MSGIDHKRQDELHRYSADERFKTEFAADGAEEYLSLPRGDEIP
jgi:hypothetical protein